MAADYGLLFRGVPEWQPPQPGRAQARALQTAGAMESLTASREQRAIAAYKQKADRAASLAFAALKQPSQWAQIRNTAIQEGIVSADQLPEKYDPEYLKGVLSKYSSIEDQIRQWQQSQVEQKVGQETATNEELARRAGLDGGMARDLGSGVRDIIATQTAADEKARATAKGEYFDEGDQKVHKVWNSKTKRWEKTGVTASRYKPSDRTSKEGMTTETDREIDNIRSEFSEFDVRANKMIIKDMPAYIRALQESGSPKVVDYGKRLERSKKLQDEEADNAAAARATRETQPPGTVVQPLPPDTGRYRDVTGMAPDAAPAAGAQPGPSAPAATPGRAASPVQTVDDVMAMPDQDFLEWALGLDDATFEALPDDVKEALFTRAKNAQVQ